MEIWLIQHGEKVGPFQDFEVRSRIQSGQLGKDDFAWHHGLAHWVRLGEIGIFHHDFAAKSDLPEGLEKPEIAQPNKQMIASGKLHLLRRFWARWLDMSIYAAAWWLLMYAIRSDIGAMITDLWVVINLFIPWFALEAWLLHRFGTTPGKWLLGIRVLNENDSNMSLKESIWRTLRVMIAGVGFGWGMLAILCQVMSWFTARRLGKPIWDHMGQHKVVVRPLGVIRVIFVVIIFFISLQLQVAVRGPHEQKLILEQYPEMAEFLERGKVWHLPVKDDQ